MRSKATEQLLRTPSTKIDLSASKPKSSASKFDWSGSVLEHMYSVNSLAPNILEAGLKGKNLTSATENQSDNEVPSLNPPVLISEQDKVPNRDRIHSFFPACTQVLISLFVLLDVSFPVTVLIIQIQVLVHNTF